MTPRTFYGVLWFQHPDPSKSFEQEKILLKLNPTDLRSGTIGVFSLYAQKEILPSFSITHLRKNSFELSLPVLQLQNPISLSRMKAPDQSCFQGEDQYKVLFCYEAQNFTLDVRYQGTPTLYIAGDRITSPPPAPYEVPETVTISHAIELAMRKNAEILADRETLKQAQENARKAYLNLIPHLNITASLHLATATISPINPFTIGNVLGAASDFIPFVFPNRWFEARAKEWHFQAAEMADILLKANIASSVHTLSLSYLADRDRLEELNHLQLQLEEFLSLTVQKENEIRGTKGKQLRHEAREAIEAICHELDVLKTQAEGVVKKDTMMITQILGLNNPDAIAGIERGTEVTSFDQIEELGEPALDIEKRKYSEIAVLNSFEIRQQQYLQEAAMVNQKSVLVNWLDVGLHPSESLGASLYSDYQISKSILKALELELLKTRRTLESKIFETVRDRNQMMALARIAAKNLKFRKTRLVNTIKHAKRLLETKPKTATVPLGKKRAKKVAEDFPVDKIQTRVQDLLLGITAFYSSRAAAEMNQGLLDRATLQGPYHRLLPHLQEFTFDRKAVVQDQRQF